MSKEDYEDETEDSEGMILSISEEGKASLHKVEDYTQIHKNDAELIADFIEENRELFEKFVKARENKDSGKGQETKEATK